MIFQDTSRVIFKNEQLYQFFPKYYSPEQMRRVILEMLEDYVRKEGRLSENSPD